MAKMSWTDKVAKTKFGGVFFTSEDASTHDVHEDQAPAVVQQVQARPMPTAFGSGVATSVTPSTFGSSFIPLSNADPNTVAKIQALADGADQKSYTKFGEIKRSVSENGVTDEVTLYRTSFVAAKAIGLPSAEVLRGLDTILNTLSAAEQRVKAEAPQRISVKVGARRQKISEIQQTAASKQSEMQQLQARLVQIQGELGQLSQAEQAEQVAIAQDEQVIRADVDRFSAALEVVRVPYVAERQKIELYGKGA